MERDTVVMEEEFSLRKSYDGIPICPVLPPLIFSPSCLVTGMRSIHISLLCTVKTTRKSAMFSSVCESLS